MPISRRVVWLWFSSGWVVAYVGGSWMWDGCVEIVLGFDTKDGCVVVGVELWLARG